MGSGGILVVESIVSLLTAALLLHHYGDLKRQNRLSSLATFLSWYLSFLILFLLPVDIASTFYRRCVNETIPTTDTTTTIDPTAAAAAFTTNALSTSVSFFGAAKIPNSLFVVEKMLKVEKDSIDDEEIDEEKVTPPVDDICFKPWMFVDDHVLQSLWRFIYWAIQLLTWFVLPLMQSYANAGDFSILGKLKSALIRNAIYYGTYLLVFGVLLIYVATDGKLAFSFSKLKVICITASNTWGLFLLVLLFGFGLVEVPRSIWNGCDHSLALARTYFKIAKVGCEKNEAEEQMEDVLERVKQSAQSISYNQPNRQYIDVILEKCPETMKGSIRPCSLDDYQNYLEDGVARVTVPESSEKYLIRLNGQVIRALQAYHRTQAQWERVVERALALEDEVDNLNNVERLFVRSQLTARRSVCSRLCPGMEGIYRRLYSPRVEWHWRCVLRSAIFRCVAVAFVIFSVMVVWSEVTFFVTSPILSVFAVAVRAASLANHYGTAVIICGITVSYLSLAAYFTIFRIRLFDYYYIAGDHLTDENSLLFIGTLLSRLTPPLCLNFLGLVHLDSGTSNDENDDSTSFTKIMGRLHLIPFIAVGFNIYFPIIILLLCFATYFSIGSRCLQFLGFHQFLGEDEMTQDFIDEGRSLLHREKRLRQRNAADGAVRRRYRFGVYRKLDKTEREGVELKPGRAKRTNANLESPSRSVEALNGTRPKSYGAATVNDRTSLLNDDVDDGPSSLAG